MRLPLRHPPPQSDPGLRRCAHLEVLAQSARGVCLGPAARALAAAKGRGRHGNALQWHLGLEAHDSEASLDWEDRIEVKMVSVWSRADGSLACDKLKVCEAGVDPWHKLANVLWVFVDRVTRVVLGHRFTHRATHLDRWLVPSWGADPHFDQPALFIEARDAADGSQAPAYYLAARLFEVAGLLQGFSATRFDAALWSRLRRAHGGRSPHLALVSAGMASPVTCPKCEAALAFAAAALQPRAMIEARHVVVPRGACALRAAVVVEPSGLPDPALGSFEQMVAAIEQREPGLDGDWRLADHVLEPDDHMH